MVHPTIDQFRAVARQGALVPVYREVMADLETPVTAYIKLSRGAAHSFLLESVERADTVGRYSFLGANPSTVFRSKGRAVTITRNGRDGHYESDDPLGELRKLMAAYEPVPVEGVPMFHGGAVGYMSYDQVRFFEKLPDKNPDALGLPDLYFMITDTIIVFDHVANTMKIVSNAHVQGSVDEAYHEAVRKIGGIEEALRRPLVVATERVHSGATEGEARSNFTREGFCQAVEKAKEYIRAGDIFQVVLSQRFERDLNASPVNLYRALRCINPSPYMTLIQYPDVTLVGSSPEVMTQLSKGRVMVRPIAGTRPRGATKEEDAALEQELLADEKELAEHIMLVDLGRNDIGRISKAGAVRPSRLKTIERYSHVMHIVSEVEGEILPGADAYAALRSTFPMGTVSGAPKIRAMEIIDELEPARRGPYAGGCGYISFDGDMDTCIVIRTMIIKDGVVYVQAGAGIVYDSDPEREFEETVNKAKALFRAVEFAERGLES
ncbi:MAG TPA: anthranilate synthase component I [Candidatus Hydrogenedentes bacterium]|nr:anthranilate synthase component I [Candidatus Hydrogenedentota bacterium]HOS01691.1 anthranilate synthase component I [Candidatus Hydrogenedentota bacterium]